MANNRPANVRIHPEKRTSDREAVAHGRKTLRRIIEDEFETEKRDWMHDYA